MDRSSRAGPRTACRSTSPRTRPTEMLTVAVAHPAGRGAASTAASYDALISATSIPSSGSGPSGTGARGDARVVRRSVERILGGEQPGVGLRLVLVVPAADDRRAERGERATDGGAEQHERDEDLDEGRPTVTPPTRHGRASAVNRAPWGPPLRLRLSSPLTSHWAPTTGRPQPTLRPPLETLVVAAGERTSKSHIDQARTRGGRSTTGHRRQAGDRSRARGPPRISRRRGTRSSAAGTGDPIRWPWAKSTPRLRNSSIMCGSLTNGAATSTQFS